MINVYLYFQQNSPECENIRSQLESLKSRYSFELIQIDIEKIPDIHKFTNADVPVLQIGPYELKNPISLQQIEVSLGAALDRQTQIEQFQRKKGKPIKKPNTSLTGADKFSFWFSRHYMVFVNLFLMLYLGLPFLAPVLMKNKLEFPAKIIYTIYRPLCHQLPFRSVFLYGQQVFYPRDLAHVPGLKTYEEFTGTSTINFLEAEKINGSEFPGMGYKVPLCERCITIYAGLLLFGLFFALTGRRIKSIPWYLWIVIGIIPIGVDGVSQLPSAIASVLPAWVPIRESNPFLRFLTGGLFGITTAWYLFPLIEESMRETARYLSRKFAVAGQHNKPGGKESNAIQGK
jgi:uncharacterized membrane protein